MAIDLSEIEVALRDSGIFNHVLGVLDFQNEYQQGIQTDNCVFILPLGTSYGGNIGGTGPVMQECIADIAVVIAKRAGGGRSGVGVNAPLMSLVEQVISLLHGQTFGHYEPIELGRGGLLPMKNMTVYWQQEFKTRYHQEAQ